MANAALMVCDDVAEGSRYAGWLRAGGYPTAEAHSSAEALEYHQRDSFPLTVSDLMSPQVDGVGLMRAVRALNPQAEIMFLLSNSDPARAVVAAMEGGPADLLFKPIDRAMLLECVRGIGSLDDLFPDTASERQLRQRFDFSRIVAVSPAMLRLLSLSARVAGHRTPVLITGESGTGKELLARAIHTNSVRAARPLVSINCAAIPETLLESELFGYQRGAFTGAHADKPGVLTTAEGGTLFLDEVAELALPTQAKLLRFLEDGTYFPVGSVRPRTADVRLVAATNACLSERVAAGRFRGDLYYRLSAFPLHIPPLRERRQDIVPLAQHFLHQLGREVGKEVPGLSREAVTYIESRRWEGNGRELRNAVERAVIVSTGNLLTSADFRTLEGGLERGRAGGESVWELPEDGIDLAALNRTLVATALDRTGRNISAAARLLRTSRAAMRYRVRKYRLTTQRAGGRSSRLT